MSTEQEIVEFTREIGQDIDLKRLDLQTIALAQFGDWRSDAKKATDELSNLALDLTIPARIAEAKSLRERLINAPRAQVRKVSKALKSKLTAVSKAVGAEEDAAVKAYDEAEQLITPQINKREQEIEERRAKFQGYIDAIVLAPKMAKGKTAAEIQAAINELKLWTFGEAWAEFAKDAEAARDDALVALAELFATTKREEDLEQQRQEQAERQRELDEQEAKLKKDRDELEAKQKAAAVKEVVPIGQWPNEISVVPGGADVDAARALLDAAPVPMENRMFSDEHGVMHSTRRGPTSGTGIARTLRDATGPRRETVLDVGSLPARFTEGGGVEVGPIPVVSDAFLPAVGDDEGPGTEPIERGEPTMSLTALNDILAPIQLNSEGLKTLGFEHSTNPKIKGKLYHRADVPAICNKLVEHLLQAIAEA